MVYRLNLLKEFSDWGGGEWGGFVGRKWFMIMTVMDVFMPGQGNRGVNFTIYINLVCFCQNQGPYILYLKLIL